MSPKNNKRNAISFNVDDDTLKRLKRDLEGAPDEFPPVAPVASSLAEAARHYLEIGLQAEDGELPERIKSAEDILKERKLEAEIAERERKNAVATGELISMDVALERLERDYSQVRQRIQQISIDGLSDEQRDQLEKAKQDCMTDLSGDSDVTKQL